MPAPNDLDKPGRRLRCAIYVRISHDPFGTSTAPERQLDDCRKYAELMGWEVVEVFEDRDVSAYQKGVVRPAYEDMLTRIDEFDVVLCWRLDRLVRRILEFNRFWKAAEAAEVRLAAVTQPIDTSDAIGLAFVYVLVGFAQAEAEAMSSRIKSQQAEMARNGRSKRAGTRPFGLTKDWTAIVPAEAEVIREVAQRLLDRESDGSIVNDLNARGVRPVASERWTRRSLARMMQSGRVFGWRESFGELIAPGDWPAILDEATGRAVREYLNSRNGPKSNGQKHLLSGILRCCRCGGRLHTGKGSDGTRRYICPPKADGGCSGISINADKADVDLEAMIIGQLETPDMIKALKARRKRRAGSSEAEILAELADLDRQTQQNAKDKTAGELPRAAWLAAEKEIEERRDILNARLADHRKDDPLGDLVKGGGGIADRYRALPLPRRRAVIETLVEKVVVHRKDSERYLATLRVALAEEAEEFQAQAEELRQQATDEPDPVTRRRMRDEAIRLGKWASRRRIQAQTGTGGGRWRPERLQPVWRT